MFKRQIVGSLTFGFLTATTAFLFQNCAAEFTATSAEDTTFSSVSVNYEDPHVPTELLEKVSTSYEPLLADRYYIQSLFADNFGPKAATVDTATMITDSLTNGSACNPYNDHSVAKRASDNAKLRANAMEVCGVATASRITSPVNPKPTVTRQAKMVRACSDLTTNNETFNFFLKKISAAPIPEPSEENVVKAVDFFYRSTSTPDQPVIDSLRMLFSSQTPTVDDWRSVVYTICISPQWQVL